MIGGPLDGKILHGAGDRPRLPEIRYPLGDAPAPIALYELDTSGEQPVYKFAGYATE